MLELPISSTARRALVGIIPWYFLEVNNVKSNSMSSKNQDESYKSDSENEFEGER